ncbi:MAG: hypothetical protein EZS28_055924, partial [Streblomastix strix]
VNAANGARIELQFEYSHIHDTIKNFISPFEPQNMQSQGVKKPFNTEADVITGSGYIL